MALRENRITVSFPEATKKRLEELAKEKGITRELLFKNLKGLKARYDRYSIVDVYSRDDIFINEILDEFDKIVSDDKNVNNQWFF